MTVTLLPSAERLFVAWASTVPALAAIHGGRVGTRLHDTRPAMRVTRIGAAPPEPWQDDADLQVECWAVDQTTADLLARTLVASMPAIGGYLPAGGGRVHSGWVTSGPFWSPDAPTLSGHARYLLAVSLIVTS